MKFLVAIVQAYDSDRLLHALTDAGYGATKINSLGGFLRMANSTILMGMEDERVPEAISIIRSVARRRVEVKMDAAEAEYSEWFAAGYHEVPIGGGVIFAVPLDEMYRVWPDRIERRQQTPTH
ncbi:MAG: cyclic-di-AMP receptor [Thermomicrobiales bacterium]|nr:cyclic-di-AMP receptor [Thermomicrobiales bacterium]MCO5225766.1 cyclic-di-AMP receptor [Thermomicrobiales bacterium]MCO5227538.1 cyclic-di-AMP receptor [Thermomicrobiales bacterium]